MISDKLQKLIAEAMRLRDSVRVSTLRMLLSELNNEKIRLQKDLAENDEINVIKKEVKKRKEAIDAYLKGGAKNRAEQEEKELKILQEFLPPELTEEELLSMIDSFIEIIKPEGIQDMGRIISNIKEKRPDVDGSILANMVRQKLQGI